MKSLKIIQIRQKKKRKGTEHRQDKKRKANGVVGLNTTVLIIRLNVNGLNTLMLKYRNWQLN